MSCLHLFQKSINQPWSIEPALSGEYGVIRETVLSTIMGFFFPSGSSIHEAGQAQIWNGFLLLRLVLLEWMLAGIGKLTSM